MKYHELAKYILLVALWIPFHCFSQNNSYELKKECISVINQGTTALVANDWSRLLQEAEKYIKKCSKVWGEEDLANAHERRSISLFELGFPMRSLDAADACLQIDYRNTGCHLRKAINLHIIGKDAEAISSIQRVERISEHELSILNRELKMPQTPLEKEATNSKIGRILAIKEHADFLKEKWIKK